MPISQSEYARRRGVSRQYVSRLVKEGVIRLKNGKVDPAQADAASGSGRNRGVIRHQTRVPVFYGVLLFSLAVFNMICIYLNFHN